MSAASLPFDSTRSLQDQYGPNVTCFGCGPANDKGLRIKSFVRGEELVASFRPEPHHNAFDGVLNGGICGALLDCHSNWAAAWALLQATGVETFPCTVTADFAVKLKRPTPMELEITVRARVVKLSGDQKVATVEATLEAGGKVTATCTGNFVAVGPGHPGYHRW